ncbi:hypothetical protein FB459_0689 [Yimella lutea]|uniref:Uncharacterized protein n=1 Tax=Yimella lutea TaxID=587872 RepID=A0A542ED75_9MICO|nr:hypothetical protein FB459_0689 [Yimella lutea]
MLAAITGNDVTLYLLTSIDEKSRARCVRHALIGEAGRPSGPQPADGSEPDEPALSYPG